MKFCKFDYVFFFSVNGISVEWIVVCVVFLLIVLIVVVMLIFKL